MKIFNFNKEKPIEGESIMTKIGNQLKSFNFNGASSINEDSIKRSYTYKGIGSINGLPTIDIYNSTRDWVKFDVGDNFPLYLLDLYITSPINNAIINNKSNMIAGKDVIYNDFAETEYEKITNITLINNMREVIRKAAFDYTLYGAFALELFYNGKILIKIDTISPINLRAKRPKTVYTPITQWIYSKDFIDTRVEKYEFDSYIPYKETDKSSVIYYFKSENAQTDIYGVPSWLSSQKSILIDGKIADFHNSNLDNSFSPSTHIHFFTSMNQSDTDIQDFAKKLNTSFAGARNSGKPFITSSNNADTAIKVDPLTSSDLDKRFESLQTSITNQILIGHSVTDSELVGVSIPGKLGTANKQDSYKMFESIVIGPNRKTIEGQFNKLFVENKIKLQIELTEYNIF